MDCYAIGDHAEFAKTVSDYDVYGFAGIVGDFYGVHVNEEYAKTTPFGGRICPSHLTMSFSTAMTGRLFTDTVLALLAVERGRFFGPVRPGDTIRTDVEVVEKKISSDSSRGIVVFRDHVINQREETVFQMDKIVLLKRRLA